MNEELLRAEFEKWYATKLNINIVDKIMIEALWKAWKAGYKLKQKPSNALRIYCEGVMKDFPETKTWMKNILKLAGH